MDKESAILYNKRLKVAFLLKNKEELKIMFDLDMILHDIDMSEKDAIKNEKNPFVKKTFFGLLFLLGGIILFPAYFLFKGLGVNFEGMSTLLIIIGACSIGFSLLITGNILF